MKNLGDKIAAVATPIARTLGLPCIDPDTQQLRPESPCFKAKTALNQGEPFWDTVYDRFWKPKALVDETPESRESTAPMEYIVNKTVLETIAVTADTLDQAEELAMRGEGKIMSRNKSFNARPKPDKPNQLAAPTVTTG